MTSILEFFNNFFGILLIPLQWLPSSILNLFDFFIFVFSIFIVGKILKWIWDALPIA